MYRVFDDDRNCLASCPSGKYEHFEQSEEKRCVDDCRAWYWAVKDGRCTEERWRVDVAIAVPIVVVLVAGGAVAFYFFWKRRKSGMRKIESVSLQDAAE